jgi:hypothetical protein
MPSTSCARTNGARSSPNVIIGAQYANGGNHCKTDIGSLMVAPGWLQTDENSERMNALIEAGHTPVNGSSDRNSLETSHVD